MFSDKKKISHLSKEVAKAINDKIPVIALESTIITHGMPYPDNYNTALEAEEIVRKSGSIPATIAVVNGQIKIGLSKQEIHILAQNQSVQKLSTNNLSMAIAQKRTGSTTVAATLTIIASEKIQVFATGGIGGAHRGSEKDFDISADLIQLASTPVNVICAGPKAILDIPKTVQLLETLGIPIISYRYKNIPAFWSRDSGVKSPIVAETVTEIVQSFFVRSKLGLQSAQLICNPIPDAYEISAKEIEPLINKSIRIAKEKEIKGKEITPFLLSQILKITGGRSLKANRALLFNNIDLATKIAKSLRDKRC